MKYLCTLLFPLIALAQAPYAEVLNRLELDLKLNVGTERLTGKDCHVTIQYDRDELMLTIAQGEWGNRFASMALPASGMTRAFGDKVSDVVYQSSENEKVLSYRQTRNSAGKETTDILLKVSEGRKKLYTLTINERVVYCELKN